MDKRKFNNWLILCHTVMTLKKVFCQTVNGELLVQIAKISLFNTHYIEIEFAKLKTTALSKTVEIKLCHQVW